MGAHCGVAGAPIAGCVPINILGPAGSIDPAAKSYLTFTGVSTGFNEQQTALATAHGQLVALPNKGDISVAVGTDFRKEAGGFTPDPLTATGDTTGVAVQPTHGSYDVFEGYGELSVVPISGDPIAQWVELDLAARGFRYDSFGSGVTWKAGGLVRTVEGIALRGTYSTAFRAPSVAELFSGQSDSFPSIEDPCDTRPPSAGGAVKPLDPKTAAQCKAQMVPDNASFGTSQQRTVGGGNPNLQAETAKVFTAGVVFEPPQVPGLAMTADYWNIDISKAIQAISVTSVLANCYQGGIQSFCQQIHRNPTQGYAIDYIDASLVNAGSTSTSGLDLSLAYSHQLGPLGKLHAQVDGTYLFKYNLDDSTHVIHGRGNYDLGVNPAFKGDLAASLTHPSGLAGGFNVHYISSFTECQFADCTDGLPGRTVDSWYKIDVYASYTFHNPTGVTTLSVGVNNIADRDPALIYIGADGNSDGSAYDLMGRLLYARLTEQF
jgi:outer membrane receptor protein involved in Fe transport